MYTHNITIYYTPATSLCSTLLLCIHILKRMRCIYTLYITIILRYYHICTLYALVSFAFQTLHILRVNPSQS